MEMVFCLKANCFNLLHCLKLLDLEALEQESSFYGREQLQKGSMPLNMYTFEYSKQQDMNCRLWTHTYSFQGTGVSEQHPLYCPGMMPLNRHLVWMGPNRCQTKRNIAYFSMCFCTLLGRFLIQVLIVNINCCWSGKFFWFYSLTLKWIFLN